MKVWKSVLSMEKDCLKNSHERSQAMRQTLNPCSHDEIRFEVFHS